MIHNLNFAQPAMVWIMLTQFSLLNPIVFVTFTLGIHGVYQVFQTDVLHITFICSIITILKDLMLI